MTIEFNTVYGQVPDKVIINTRKELMSLIHSNKKIRRMEITLKDDRALNNVRNKICSIKILVNGDSIVLHTRSESFETAIHDAIKETAKRFRKQLQGREYAEPMEKQLIRFQ